jgi:hypothetical protein
MTESPRARAVRNRWQRDVAAHEVRIRVSVERGSHTGGASERLCRRARRSSSSATAASQARSRSR